MFHVYNNKAEAWHSELNVTWLACDHHMSSWIGEQKKDRRFLWLLGVRRSGQKWEYGFYYCNREKEERERGRSEVRWKMEVHRQHSTQSAEIWDWGLIPMSSLQTGIRAHTIIPSPARVTNPINSLTAENFQWSSHTKMITVHTSSTVRQSLRHSMKWYRCTPPNYHDVCPA